MARTNPDAQRFSAWLRPLMLTRGLNQTQLRKLLEAAGVSVGRQTVSQWYNGDNVPVPDSIMLIAQILRADPAEALRKAGHLRIADYASRGTDDREPAEPVNPIIEKIANDPLLPSDVKERIIAFHRRKMQQAELDTQDFAEGLKG